MKLIKENIDKVIDDISNDPKNRPMTEKSLSSGLTELGNNMSALVICGYGLVNVSQIFTVSFKEIGINLAFDINKEIKDFEWYIVTANGIYHSYGDGSGRLLKDKK